MAYAKFRSDCMLGTHFSGSLVGVHYQKAGKNAAIENGNFVLIGDCVENHHDIRIATAPKANSPITKIAVIGSPEVDKTKQFNNLDEFINEAGEEARGYYLDTRHTFSVTAEALTGATPTVGYKVELADDTTKGNVVETATTGATQIGEIIAIENEWIVIEG